VIIDLTLSLLVNRIYAVVTLRPARPPFAHPRAPATTYTVILKPIGSKKLTTEVLQVKLIFYW